MKTQSENPTGLHRKYHIQKVITVPNPKYDNGTILGLREPYIEALIPVDNNSEYFILRLDTGAGDREHVKACRIGVHAYADAIVNHLPRLAADLKERYPLLS
jgi:hypothetical protein